MAITPLPFDPTGLAPTNKVINEQQVITSVNFRDYHYIIPNLAPFFAESVVIGFKNPDGSARTLVEGVDYYLSHGFISASRACAKPIFGSIEFLSTDLAGVVTITYQSIGGSWTIDQPTIAAILANNLNNPRTTAWEQIVNLPIAFPVINHEWDLVDLVGASQIVDSLDEIRDTISAGGASGLAAHVADKGNPHDTTALQVGLGSVQNYPIATIAQAQGGTNSTTYMTPFLVAQAIVALGQSNLNTHLSDYNNPHQTTKAQVGLGLVQNYAMADNPTAIAGTSSTVYMSPLTTAAVVAIVNTALQNHVNNQLNPHNTTKDQLFLFNVANYPPSTSQQAQTGTDDASYMTPLKTAQAIALQSSTGLANHLSDYTNPHQTTKTQVGLGLVDNFATASGTDATTNSISNKFMTPQRTYASVMYFVGNDFITHLNATNPHNTNAVQVGLGSVQNFGLASQSDAETGTSNGVYMTPLRTTQAISFQVGNAFTAHIAQTNPHGTTKNDVGLGLVQNYGIATDSDAQAGTSTTSYLTPHGASLLVQNGGLGSHIANLNNPHQTTAAQVGLSNVLNYAVATDSDATAGISTTLYLTPKGGKLAAQAILSPHIADTTNPHQVTANQVGLGLVQNYNVATQAQAQAGTNDASYMTPLKTAQAIVALGQSNLNTHLSDFNNPHATTAAQVNAYSKPETDTLLQGKLGINDTAANSNQLGGSTLSTITAGLTNQLNSALSNLATTLASSSTLQAHSADSNNTTNYSWAQLGTLAANSITQTGTNAYQNAKTDLVWLVSGGEDPASQYGVTTLIRVSMRGSNSNDPTLYYVGDQTPSLPSGGVDYGYVWDGSSTVTVYARMPKANNQMTVTELSKGGSTIAINYLGYTPPSNIVMMTKNADIQSQLNQLQSDLVSSIAALTTAVNNA